MKMTRQARRFWLELFIVLTLTALALSVRLYRLPEIPPGLYSDEAANGVDILGVLGGQHPIFFERNNGREPLFIYLQALSVAQLGATPFALRLTSALIGAATVPAVYWLAREAFAASQDVNARWLALWTALFLTFSYWHINFSRIGLRAIMLPLLAAVTFAWFWRAWRHLEARERLPWLDLVLCGVFMGLSLYTYVAARFLPVLLIVVVLAASLQYGRQAERRRRIAMGTAIIGATALMIFAPLGAFFLSHPASFWQHVNNMSALGPTGHAAAWQDLAESTLKTMGMFWVTASGGVLDPAARPGVDPVLGVWLALGIILALKRWRSLPYLFTLAWMLLLAVPAMISEGAPNFLRALGVVPAVYMLAVLAMLAAGRRLVKEKRLLTALIPLPFLIFSIGFDLHSYFNAAWHSEGLAFEFDIPFMTSIASMHPDGGAKSTWLLPVHAITTVPDAGYILDFLSNRKIETAIVRADEPSGPNELRRATAGYETAHLFSWGTPRRHPYGDYVLDDWKGILNFLLTKYGKPLDENAAGNATHDMFELPKNASYQVATAETPVDISFDGKVKLTSVAYGHTATSHDESATSLEEKWLPAGHTAWTVLRWQAQTPLSNNLQTSLFLTDEAGHLAGQVDGPLVSDDYYYSSQWQQGKPASSYHILRTLPALPPGRYDLYVAVYEKGTLRRYPVLDQQGAHRAPAARIGTFNITRPVDPQQVQPEVVVPSSTFANAEVALLGYDQPLRKADPGQSLAVTLYWRARSKPSRDYQVQLQLQDQSGRPIAQHQSQPANGHYPTAGWLDGEIVRDWQQLTIPSDEQPGTYQLSLNLVDGMTSVGSVNLGNIEITGRPREFVAPVVQYPTEFNLGNKIELLGYDLPQAAVKPGAVLPLTLHWKGLQRMETSFTAFVHLLGSDGQVWAQQDILPGQGQSPTTSWLEGEFIADQYGLTLASETPPGKYLLEVGMYDAKTGERLPVTDRNGQSLGDRILLSQTIEVER
jgi:4-amino-4-deoxy-L-arabinose transferase-like glycosyltransferase